MALSRTDLGKPLPAQVTLDALKEGSGLLLLLLLLLLLSRFSRVRLCVTP